MSHRLFILSILLYTLSDNEVTGQFQESVIKMYKVNLEGNHDYVGENYSSILRAVNRHKSLANMEGWLLQKLQNVTIEFRLFKYYTQFRPHIINLSLNYCDLMSGRTFSPYFAKMFINRLVNNSNLVHSCPFDKGYVYIRDVWLDTSKIKFPLNDGKYLLTVDFHEGNPKVFIGKASFYGDVYKKNTFQVTASAPKKKII